jgi:outer membrane protein OmpA-like peptidoglycan-associated protein
MKKIMIFIIFCLLSTPILAETENKEARGLETRSPRAQMIDIYYDLEEPLIKLREEVNRINRQIEKLKIKQSVKKAQQQDLIAIIEKGEILFSNNSAKLSNTEKEKLDNLTLYLKELCLISQNPEKMIVQIEGKADGVGTEEHNLNLSYQRAKTVQKYLKQEMLKNKMPDFFLQPVAFGENRFHQKIKGSNNPTERVVNFTIKTDEIPEENWQELKIRLSIIKNAIGNLESLVEIRKNHIEFPYKGYKTY